MLGDGRWIEETKAEPNAWKALEKTRLEPGNGYTKRSPNIDAALLDWSGRDDLQAKVARDMRRVPQSTFCRSFLTKACIDQPPRAGPMLPRGWLDQGWPEAGLDTFWSILGGGRRQGKIACQNNTYFIPQSNRLSV